MGGLRRGGAQAEAAGAACYDGNLAFEGEEGGEIVELCFGHGDDWKGAENWSEIDGLRGGV